MSLDLDAIKVRCEAAGPGPWINPGRPRTLGGYHHYICEVGTVFVVNGEEDGSDDDDSRLLADAEFIAHARADVPALVAEVERLTAENASLARGLNVVVQSHRSEP